MHSSPGQMMMRGETKCQSHITICQTHTTVSQVLSRADCRPPEEEYQKASVIYGPAEHVNVDHLIGVGCQIDVSAASALQSGTLANRYNLQVSRKSWQNPGPGRLVSNSGMKRVAVVCEEPLLPPCMYGATMLPLNISTRYQTTRYRGRKHKCTKYTHA